MIFLATLSQLFSLVIIHSLNATPIWVALPLFGVLVIVELSFQFYKNLSLYRLNETLTNISCGLIQQSANLVLKVVAVGIYQWLYEHLALFSIPVNGWSIITLFILADFCYYWAHRKSHEVHLLWGSHVVHHQSERFNLSVALRQGMLQTLVNFWCYLPLAILGFDTLTFLSISILINLYQFWLHTEVVGRLGWLEYVLNTPSHHRVHHGRNPNYLDKNFGGVLIIWDRWFGTFAPEREVVVYGTTYPVDSWNPLWVNFQPYRQIVDRIRRTPGWLDKWQILWEPPNEKPTQRGNKQTSRELESRRKYNPQANPWLQCYILFQFLVAGGSMIFFLMQEPLMAFWKKGIWVGLAIFTLVNIGAISERTVQITPLETFRGSLPIALKR